MTPLLLTLLFAPSSPPPVVVKDFATLTVREARDLDGCRVKVRFTVGGPAWKATGVTVLGPCESDDGNVRVVLASDPCEADKGDVIEVVGRLTVTDWEPVGGVASCWAIRVTAEAVAVIEDDD